MSDGEPIDDRHGRPSDPRSRFFQALVENALDILTVFDRNGTIQYESPSIERVLGYRPHELVGQNAFSLVHPDDVGRVLQLFNSSINDPTATATVVFRFRHRNGSWRDIEVTARNLIADPDVNGVLIVARDVSDRARTEAALSESEFRLRTIVGAAPLVLFALDRDGRFTLSDGKGLAALGLKPGEAVGRTIYEMYAGVPEAAPAFEEVRSGRTVQFFSQVGDAYFETTCAPLRDADGVFTGAIGVGMDITDRKRIEQQLLQAQKMESIGRLAGGVAHDFNNLLTAILGYAEAAREQLDPDSSPWQDIEEVLQAGHRAASLTQQLLAFARRQVVQPQVLNLADRLHAAEKMLRRIIGEDIDLAIAPATDLWMVRADPGHVDQLLLNLAVNARDAMPKGGTLTFRTGNVTVSRTDGPWPADVSPGDYVCLTVMDTGVGMDDDTLAHVFEPFFTTKEQGKGTGLGLPTCYGIVKQAGGHISVTSNPGSGTTFDIWLPRTAAAEAATSRPESPAARATGRETVLIAEDEQLVRQLVARLLTELGYEVLQADSGEEALAQAASFNRPIHLLLTDIVMPGINGRELAQQLLEARSDLRVLYMSGYVDREIVLGNLTDWNGRYLQKPFTTQELAKQVRAALDLPAMDATNRR